MHRLAWILALLFVPACGGGTAPVDAPSPLDAPVDEEHWTLLDAFVDLDAPPSIDAPSPLDAPVDEEHWTLLDADSPMDAPTPADAALRCAAGSAVSTRLAGVCDGRGILGCQMWTDGLAGGRTSFARCVPPDGFCARADVCSGSTAESCTCGGQARCADDQICVAQPDGPARCECITPAG